MELTCGITAIEGPHREIGEIKKLLKENWGKENFKRRIENPKAPGGQIKQRAVKKDPRGVGG